MGERRFNALQSTPIGDLHLCRIQTSPRCAQQHRHIEIYATLVFNHVLSGASIAEQDGRVTPLRVGDGALCDADRPYRLHPDGAFEIHQINCWKTRERRSPATCGAGVSSVALNNREFGTYVAHDIILGASKFEGVSSKSDRLLD
jgi:hypothetical protein